MLEKFSSGAQRIISLAEALAFEFNHSTVGSEHLLLAILKAKDNNLSKELNKSNIDYYTFYPQIRNLYSEAQDNSLYVQYTFELKEILANSIVISEKNNESLVSVDSLSYSLISRNNVASELLNKHEININTVMKMLNNTRKKKSELLSLNDLHLLGESKKDPLIGRENEIEQLLNALCRRNKPNAILLGEPGVGKTAIVEEVARRIYENKIPSLKNKRIYELDIASTVSGTKYRGEFEDKIKKIIKKVIEDKDAMLFIDEIHTIVKAGGAEGAIDASNILKPYLSRGEIQIIGATTEEEFNLTFEKDKALKRRFQLIHVDETNKEETKEILYKIKPLYEKFYKIKIDNYLLDEIVDLASEYLLNQRFPDKAIDILDNSCVNAKDHLTIENINNTMKSYYKIKPLNNLDTLEEKLKQEIVGQEKVVKDVVRELSLITRIKKETSPNLVLLFNGPSGCGKTKCADLISSVLFNQGNYVVINLSNYKDVNGVNKLINSTNNGYLEVVSPLVKTLSRNPSSLVVFENIDKASFEIKEFVKDVFDKGYFYDNRGSYINCKNAIFILISSVFDNTYNDFASYLTKEFDTTNKGLEQCLGEKLISQIDRIVEFKKLSKNELKEIAFRYVKKSELSLETSQIDEAISSLKNDEFEEKGARIIYKKIKENLDRKDKIRNN